MAIIPLIYHLNTWAHFTVHFQYGLLWWSKRTRSLYHILLSIPQITEARVFTPSTCCAPPDCDRPCREVMNSQQKKKEDIQRGYKDAPVNAQPKSRIQTFTWHLQTTSASVANKSTTFPLPSSPHCAPSTTVTLFPVSPRERFCPVAAGWLMFLWSLADQVRDMMAVALARSPQEDSTACKSGIAISVTS